MDDELEELKASLKERKMKEKAPKAPKKGTKKPSLGRSAAAAAEEEQRRRAASEAALSNASSSPEEGVEVRAPSPEAFEYASFLPCCVLASHSSCLMLTGFDIRFSNALKSTMDAPLKVPRRDPLRQNNVKKILLLPLLLLQLHLLYYFSFSRCLPRWCSSAILVVPLQ